MNASSIKTVLLLAVLGAVGYGVYLKLNNSPGNTSPPKAVDGWASQPPKIELPTFGAAAPTVPGGPTGVAATTGASSAPPFALNIPAPGQKEFSPGQVGLSSPPSYPDKTGLTTAGGRPLADPFPARSNVQWPNPSTSPPATGPEVASSQQKNDLDSLPRTAPGSALASDGPDEEVRRAFAALMDSATARLNKGELAEVHLLLSEWYGDPRLPPDQASQLSELLSQLAGTVIYSQQSFLERPYVVQSGDSLEKIGQAHNVPWQMLAKINNLRNPADMHPGRELKVVRGPFNAIVDLSRYELVLMLDGRYAGRFAIGVGRDCPPLGRQYVVRDKRSTSPASASNPVQGEPSNGLWIDLGGGVGIHGTKTPQDIGRNSGQGAIFLAERDLEDLYDILTVGSNGSNGSTVIIRR